MSSKIKIAGRAFAVPALDAAVLKRIHDDWDAEDYDGMLLFLDEWADLLTFATAKQIVLDFDLQEELGDPETIEERYEYVDEVFYDIEDALNKSDVRDVNRDSSIAKVGGPEYSAGRDGLKFGLLFHASSIDLEDLRNRFPKTEAEEAEEVEEQTDDEELAEEIIDAEEEVAKAEETRKAASVITIQANNSSWCTQRAVNLIKSVDFGYTSDAGIVGLEQADDLLSSCDIRNANLKLAIRYFLTDRKKSREHVYGTVSGSIDGALNELVNTLELPIQADYKVVGDVMSDSRFVTFRGALYELVADAASPQKKYAYDLPADMKGVKPCTPKDVDEKKPPGDQVWCVWTSDGKKLRARYKTKKEALRYKVLMINRYWSSGKGKTRKDRPSNK